MIECPSCNGTGYEALESATGGMVDTECTCAMGRAVVSPLIGPKPGTSHQLGEQSIDRHRSKMQAEGRYECFHCIDWHPSGEKCPQIIHAGWLAPQYRQQGETE